jgi:hypothetical protein
MRNWCVQSISKDDPGHNEHLHTMKMYQGSGGIAPYILRFLSLDTDGGKWSPSCPGCLAPRKTTSGIHERRAPELVWMWWWREKSCLLLGIRLQLCYSNSSLVILRINMSAVDMPKSVMDAKSQRMHLDTLCTPNLSASFHSCYHNSLIQTH